jgi:hypothetical protein
VQRIERAVQLQRFVKVQLINRVDANVHAAHPHDATTADRDWAVR